LHLEDADDVAPVPLGDLAAGAIPLELVQDRVLRRIDRILARAVRVFERQCTAAAERFAIERTAGEHVDVHLQHRLQVNHIECRPAANGLLGGVSIDVVVIDERGNERLHVLGLQVRDEVGVERRTGNPVGGAGDRPDDRVAHRQLLEHVDHGRDRRDDVRRVHRPQRSRWARTRSANSQP
jgi:hypothetical protein